MLGLLQVALGVFLQSHTVGHDAQAQSAPKKTPVKIIYSALTASNGPVWLAADHGLYEKYGLEVQIVHGRGASPIKRSPAARSNLAISPAHR